MAIRLLTSGSDIGLFNRLGKFFHALRSSAVYQGDSTISSASPDLDAIGTSFTEIVALFAAADSDVIKDLASQRDSIRGSQSGWTGYQRQVAEDLVIAQVERDVTLAANKKNLGGAIEELIKQLVGSGSLAGNTADNDVDASTVSITLAAATKNDGSANTGNATLVGSVKRPDGRDNELVFAEVAEVFCTTSQDIDGAGRAESWAVNGEASVDPLDYRWPDGSGASITLTTVDASQDNDGNNLLTNSDFEDWTSNVPDNWTLTVGTAGTTIDDETVVIYGTHGAKALKITGDAGGTLTAITQAFDDDDGTEATLKPNTRYLFNCYVKDSGAGLTAGVLTFALIDGGGSVMTNDAGSNLSTTLAFGTTTGTYASFSFAFVTPKVLPTTGVKFRIAVTTPLTNGESMYIDDLAMAEGVELYTGGPVLAIFAGSTNPIIGDKYTATVANNYAGEFQLFFDRCFDMKGLGMQLPSDTGGSETIADSLIG